MKTVLRRQLRCKALLLQQGTEWGPSVMDSGDEHVWEAFIDSISRYAIQVLLSKGGEKD